MNDKKPDEITVEFEEIAVEMNYILSIFNGIGTSIQDLFEIYNDPDNRLVTIQAALSYGCDKLKKIIEKGVYTDVCATESQQRTDIRDLWGRLCDNSGKQN